MYFEYIVHVHKKGQCKKKQEGKKERKIRQTPKQCHNSAHLALVSFSLLSSLSLLGSFARPSVAGF